MTTVRIHRSVPEPEPTFQAVREEVLENEHVLVTETTYPVGGSVPMHTHRFPHVLYVIEGGTVQTTAPDGVATRFDVRKGETLWRGPQSHSTRNLGSKPVRLVEVEIKDTLMRVGGDRTPRAVTPDDLHWVPDDLDHTRVMAPLLGDPTKAGPYTARMRARPGYMIALHQHPDEDENLTVLSGALHWSCGDAGSGASEHVLPAGSFVVFPAGTPHRLWTTEETVLQMTGIGPRKYVFLHPEQDPRVQH